MEATADTPKPENETMDYIEGRNEDFLNYADPLQIDYDIEALDELEDSAYKSIDLIIDYEPEIEPSEPSTSKAVQSKKKVSECFFEA